MNISGFRFILITILILLIPIYGNWKLLLFGEKTKGVVVKTIEENAGVLLSFYTVIEYETNQKKYTTKGPENIEYPTGKQFSILYNPQAPENSIIFSIKGIYLNRFTSVSVVLFILWIAFYLSFSPKSENRKSCKRKTNPNKQIRRKKLL